MQPYSSPQECNNTCHRVSSYHPALRSGRVQSTRQGRTVAHTQVISRSPVKHCIYIGIFWKSITTSASNSSNNGNTRKRSSQSIHKRHYYIIHKRHYYPLHYWEQCNNKVDTECCLWGQVQQGRRCFQTHLTTTGMHNCSFTGLEESRNQTTTPTGSSAGRNERQTPRDLEKDDKSQNHLYPWEPMQLVKKCME